MKKFIYRFLIFFLLVILIDQGLGYLIKILYNRTNDYSISKLRYSLNEANEDIIILGSSRAHHHYNSNIIKSVTGHSAYNAGFGGQGLQFSFIQLTEILKRHKPKLIIVDVSSNILLDKESNQKLSILNPFYSESFQIKQSLVHRSLINKIKFLSSIYPYNSQLFDIMRGTIHTKLDSLNGFQPLFGRMDTIGLSDKLTKGYSKKDIFNMNLSQFSDINDLCKRNDIKLYFIISPVYYQNRIMKDLNDTICNYIKELNYPKVFDYSDFQQISGDNKFFTDNLHMNNLGAESFSTKISEEILKNEL